MMKLIDSLIEFIETYHLNAEQRESIENAALEVDIAFQNLNFLIKEYSKQKEDE